ncbi:MAG: LCP family protein [Clostridia bacterium]|nr:LCP family protein [Clostridia bacterium]
MIKKRKGTVITLTCIVVILALALFSLITAFAFLTKDYNHKDLSSEFNAVPPISQGVVNIALFGVDARQKDSFEGLTDSIMILSVNTDTGQLKIISIMRDSLTMVEGYDTPMKINAAYSLGGPELAIKTLNNNFDLDIKEYATVNFYGMADIIDAVGGLEIDVNENEIKSKYGINDMIYEQSLYMGIEPEYVKTPGVQTLNGVQAVSWARIRYAHTNSGENNDAGRTERQRHVMELLLNKVLSRNLTEYPKIIKALLPFMETSLSYNDIIKLSSVFRKEIIYTQTRIPMDRYLLKSPEGFGSIKYYDYDFASKIIYSYIYEDVTQEEFLKKNNPLNTKGWYNDDNLK